MGPAYSLASTAGAMIAAAGAFAPQALLVQTMVMACVAVAFSRLSEAEPNAGSSYAWVRSAFGRRAGAYAAWLLILANYFATMATALPAGVYTLKLIAPALAEAPLWDAGIGCLWIAACAGVLYLGARPTALVTAVMLCAELVVLALVAALTWTGAAHAGVPPAGGPHVSFTLFGFLNAAVLAIWMVDGWEVSASTSEESASGKRTPGAGGLWGLALTCALLFVCLEAFMARYPAAVLAAHQADILSYIGSGLGRGWEIALIATVLVSTGATLSTTMLYLSRSVFAMGRDGVLPRAAGRLDRRGDPTVALMAVSAGVLVSTLLTGVSPSVAAALQFVVQGSSVFLGLLFLLSALAAMRRFRADAGTRRLTGVVLPCAGALALTGLLAVAGLQSEPALRAAVLGGLLAGIPFAWWRGGRIVPMTA